MPRCDAHGRHESEFRGLNYWRMPTGGVLVEKSNSQFHVEPLAQVKHAIFHTFGGIGRYEMPPYERRSPADFSESAA